MWFFVFQKFQDNLFYKKFLVRIDCKFAKEILQKDVKNLVSKQIFASWQAILFAFDFKINFIKGESNFLPDFPTRELLQGGMTKHISCITWNEWGRQRQKSTKWQRHYHSSLTNYPHEPLLFYLYDPELYYTVLCGPCYSEYPFSLTTMNGISQ